MMNLFKVLVMGMAAIGAGSVWAASGDIEIPLTPTRPSIRDASSHPSTPKRVPFQSTVPAGQWKLPDFGGNTPAFATIRIGGKIRLLAVDTVPEADKVTDSLVDAFGQTSEPEVKFYNRLHFDANGNRDLTDDPVISATPHRNRGDRYFTTIFTQVATTNITGETASPYAFNLALTGTDNRNINTFYCRLFPGLIYTGTAALEGVTYFVTMVDENMNGSFTDAGVDKLFLSDNKQAADMYPLTYSDLLVVGDRSYRLKLDVAAPKLVLCPATDLKGKLLVSESTDYLTLRGPDLVVAMLHPSREATVPVGAYAATSYRLARKDGKDRMWYIQSKGPMKSPSAETTPTNSATPPYGEPFEVALNCKPQYRGKDSEVSISFKILGKGKESVAIPTRSNAPAQAQAASSVRSRQTVTPTYEITDSRGALIKKGSFQLG